uniref:Uncharacterized protein n=1 Tax=Fagus sylvatica TaxID=28930 RepID=A0A2N9EQL9_FAGSY
MATACITTMHDQICQVSCKHHSSLGTWLASAMVSFSCLGLSDSVLLYSLYVTYTALSSASSKSLGVLKVQQEKNEAMQHKLVFKYSYHSFRD